MDNETVPSSAIRRAIRITPDLQVTAKASAMWTGGVALVACAIICTTYIVRMEGKVDKSLEGVQGITESLRTIVPEHTILWNEYNRGGRVTQHGAQPTNIP